MTPGPKPSAKPRMGGGFNAGPGGGFSEHLDENAMQAAMSQKQLSQQQADPSQAQAAAQAAQQQGLKGLTPEASQQQKPREVGTITEELVSRPAKDIVKGVTSLFDLNAALGVDPKTDSPEDIAKKRQMHQRYMKLNQEQQEEAQKRYQFLMNKKKQEEEEKQQKQQQEEQAKQAAIAPPSSPKKGPKGPAGGSKKQKASNQLQQQRQQMGGGAKPKN